MSLVDLKSDLSKYRSEVSKEGKSTPDASSATNDKNFATQQPITDGLYKDVPTIQKPKVVSLTSQLSNTKLDEIKQPKKSDVSKRLGTTELDNIKKPVKTSLESKLDSTKLDDIVIPSDKRIGLEDRLASTKLDDIVQLPIESLLINSVSEFSPTVSENRTAIAGGVGLDQIESKFSNIKQTRFSSRLTESDTEISRTTLGENNNNSNVDINRQPLSFERDGTSPDINFNQNDATDNITDPKTVINRIPQSFNREDQAVAINKSILSPIGNITNPLITITRPPQFFDRTENSIEISKNVNDASDNITIPDIEPLLRPLSFDRQEQVPNIITETIQEGIVVNPNINVLRVEQGSIHTGDASEFNIDGSPIRFVGTSELERMIETDDKGPIRYEGQTIHDVDNSQLNLLGITPTFPAGRHENPSDSLYSVLGLQEVNFFSNQFALGFNQRQQLGDTKYVGFSQYVWTGGSDKGPFTNYFSDTNSFGFQIRVNAEETAYQPNTSQFDFAKITGVNYFDGNNNNTIGGFSVFTPHQITEYKTESSFLGWQGNRVGAPQVNFFDIELGHTKRGFNKFAELGESDYIEGSSIFDYDGNKQQAPSVNYFDLTNASTTMGFHNFAAFQDSKYILDASNYAWKGVSLTDSPETNYFDIFKNVTTAGFHRFAQKLETKYIRDASEFVWSGARGDAPTINYFDLVTTLNSTDGFHSFAGLYDTKYITDSSRFTWIGTRDDAPFVNYLDIPTRNVTSGFDIFVPFLESKYKNDSSYYTWNVNRQDAPVVNYFDLESQSTTTGFHKFSGMFDTKYIKDSSQFDFDGNKQNAPAVNYFDLLGRFTTAGFHTFPIFKESKYIKDSSEFDWDGARVNAPAINYFDLQGTHTTAGFYSFAQEYDSKYVKESSRFDWDGNRSSAPAVNYFDLPGKFTTEGFHILAPFKQTRYIHESSEFDWDGLRANSPEVNYFDFTGKVTTAGFHRLAETYDSKYVEESSIFDWDGSRDESPQVNYFDLRSKFTTIGFHRLAELYDSKYVKDSSEFTFAGKFPKAGTDYFDKEKLNQTGFTLNIQPKGSSKPAGTEYFHESSFYTFKGGRPGEPVESVIDFFQNTNQTGFTMDIKRNEGLPETEYATESSIFVFQGGRPGLQSFFPDDNQTGFTLDIMAKGSSRPGTEYDTNSSDYGFKADRRPPLLNYFPDDNQTGFTLDIMPKGAGNPETEYVNESSRFGFIGLRPNGVNYFPDDNQTGFTIDIMRKGSGRPQTEYTAETSQFDWNGSRLSAPSNNYFGLYRTPIGKEYIDVQQKNNTTQAGRGFQTFYTDKTVTNYAPGYSILSTESGTNKVLSLDKPVTNFFGFTPSQRAGFLPQMTLNDGTLYPIINPELTYNLDQSGRLAIQTRRSSAGINTVNGEEFAPLSLGKRPWVQQGTLASLENQVPNIITKAAAGSYINKYERTMKDTPDGSYLASYGIRQGQIAKQYQEYRGTPLQFNPELDSTPFILRGIQIKGKTVNERWGQNSDAGNVVFGRGGGYSDQFAAINIADRERIEKWLETPKGIAWTLLQEELYKNNPLVDSITAIESDSNSAQISKTRIYNKTSLLNAIEDNLLRGRTLRIRHGEDGENPENSDRYESVVLRMNPSNDDKQNVMNFPRTVAGNASTLYSDSIRSAQNTKNIYSFYKYNRLIALMSELLPSSFAPLNSKTASSIRNAAGSSTLKISRLSGLGGPNSGTDPSGVTEIRRASHPFMKVYNTSGVLPETYPSTAKRDTWFGQKTKVGADGPTEDGTDYTYSGRMKQQKSLADGQTFDGLITALSYLLSGSKFENNTQEYPKEGNGNPDNSAYIQPNVYKIISARDPFNPKYPSYDDRLRANAVFDSDNIPNSTPNGTEPIYLKPPSGEDQQTAPIKQYSAVSYNKLKKIQRGDANRLRDYNDFRADIEGETYKKFSTDPAIADYKKNNLDNRFGFGKQGKPGTKRDNPARNNIVYTKEGAVLKQGTDYEFRGDRINIIDFKTSNKVNNLSEVEDFAYERGKYKRPGLEEGEDLITFYFSSVNLMPTKQYPVETIVFRASFDSITDNHKPSWSPVQYMGRGDPSYVFGSYERDTSFGFTVHIGSRDEMAATWRKLNALASWTTPDYRSGRMRAPLCRLNIGHLFRKTPGFINSLTYTFDNAGGTWETAKLKEDRNYGDSESKPGVLQLPKTIQVAVGFTIIGNYRPERNGVMYSLYDDAGDGLAPAIASNGALVNYFRIDDVTSANNKDAEKYLLEDPPGNLESYDKTNTDDETKALGDAALTQMYGKVPFTEKKDADGNVTYESTDPKFGSIDTKAEEEKAAAGADKAATDLQKEQEEKAARDKIAESGGNPSPGPP